MSESDVYAAPKAELIVESAQAQTAFYPSSLFKLSALFLCTFGLYTIYWFYKNWEIQKRQGKKVTPALRGLFYIFFSHSLFRLVEDAAVQKGISKSWSAGSLATLFVILNIASNGLDRMAANDGVTGFLDLFSFLIVLLLLGPIYLVQSVANKVNGDPQGNLNNTFSIANIILIVLGILLWVGVAADYGLI